ncbi:DUF3987 domain-containing protein [Bdellovibrio sp. 22V]|uniref:DUF3987 domain-containing protein n=1 Tax=Bdellovibrio sp. 22V TaxID=3044166 RepID=UPI0025431814|nr:DUF3987 domain-containing protein [Bdellovibrio sp. 22V]WII71748.1 DUF3987 domain-containing protein [Bdellovibrio sp. 22V]
MVDYMDNFPSEIRVLPNWYPANSQGAPCAYSSTAGLLPVDPKVVGGMDYDTAIQIAELTGCFIGYYLTANDEYSCIDLDVKDAETNPGEPAKWTTPEQFANYRRIMEIFDSYTEVSRHGKGVHIWFKANIGKGCRRWGVELYSQERFMICTGKFLGKIKPVNSYILEAQQLAESLRDGDEPDYELIEFDATESDETIYLRARGAENAAKFIGLAEVGDWNNWGYPSQSEADLSLMSMFAFYTESNEQCRRLFRMTQLGLREKATKSNYHVDRLLKICRSRMAREAAQATADLEHGKALADSLIARMNAQYAAVGAAHIETEAEDPFMPEDVEPAVAARAASYVPMEWPPGFVGRLAQCFYKSSIRPIREVSIIAALGVMAGIAGRSYSIPRSGLNLYLVLLAQSGVGKEDMHSSLSMTMEALTRTENASPHAYSIFDITRYASGPALMKALATNPYKSCINANDEWGKTIEMLSSGKTPNGLDTLKQVMTTVYHKSAVSSTLGGTAYADKENNVQATGGVAYSFIAEATPDTYYGALDRSMMEDGFLSRFLCIEYTGIRPPRVKKPAAYLPDDVIFILKAIVANASLEVGKNSSTDVSSSPVAESILDAFEKECDEGVNGTDDDSKRQIWSRAHLKALRLACLLAVGDDYHTPCVQEQHARWAIELVKTDMRTMFTRVKDGSIGKSDDARIKKVIGLISEYYSQKLKPVNPVARANGIVTRADIQKRAYSYAAFSKMKGGNATVAIDQTMRAMLDMGYLVECDPKKMAELNLKGKCYTITETLINVINEDYLHD